MKRVGNLWPQIVSFENLLGAAKDAARGKRSRRDVAWFLLSLEPELIRLQRELERGEYRPGEYRTFQVREPKPRLISAAPFADRVVHHALTRVLEPIFERRFVPNSFACRKGLGTHRAVASAAGIPSYTALPNYHIHDYFVEPSGWLTFNQFFAREVKPGKRPIADPRNDKVIVSPADSVFAGKWNIGANSKVTVKGVTWPIAKLLDGSSYQDAFKNGIYTHSFLNSDDYHRYHVPVAGELKEVRKIQGRVYLNLIRNADGRLQIVDGDTYQYNQERGLIVIASPEVGLVAVLLIGMGAVSSVNLTPEVGGRLQKGDEFGFFMFGGSDIVMLFQNKKVVIDAEVGKKYLQGQRIGEVR